MSDRLRGRIKALRREGATTSIDARGNGCVHDGLVHALVEAAALGAPWHDLGRLENSRPAVRALFATPQ